MTSLDVGVTAMIILGIASAVFAHFATKHKTGHGHQ